MGYILQILLHAAVSGIETAALALYLHRLLAERQTVKRSQRRVTIYIIVYAAFFAANICVSVLLPGLSILPYLMSGSILAIAVFLYSGTLFQRVFAGLTFFAYAFMTEALYATSVSFLTGHIFSDSLSASLFFIGAFLSKALLLAAVFIITRRRRARFLPMPVSHQVVLLLAVGICVFLSFADMVAVTQSSERTTFLNVLIEAGITTIAVTVFYVYGAFQRYTDRELYFSLLERQTAASERYFRRVDEIQREMRALKHDFTNHLMSLNQLLQAGDYAELGEYIHRYLGEVSRVVSETVTGVASVDGLISVKKQAALDNGIRFEASAGGVMKILINPVHLSIILSNALDNAIEACLKLPPAERYIALNMKTDDDGILISVANASGPVEIEKDGLPTTTKGNMTRHGLGLGTVKRIAERYGGHVLLESRPGEFVFTALLQIAPPAPRADV
jgi:signal transduction histidine kinase